VNGKLDPLIQTATNLPSTKCVETRLVAMTIFQPWLSTTRTIQNATFWGFVATTTAKLYVAAVANMKKVNPSMAWIESVRTSRHYRNNGLAFTLLHSMLKDARNASYKKVWSCTVQSNKAMRRVFVYK
jgi:N-acetylglutamate synthase-like GNAT family acetyltransferase